MMGRQSCNKQIIFRTKVRIPLFDKGDDDDAANKIKTLSVALGVPIWIRPNGE
jgi:hypothetical protein